MANKFLDAMANVAYTENGAFSYKTTGSDLVDQFSKAGCYIGRDINDVFEDMINIWNESPLDALRFVFYLRLITRKVKVSESETTDTVQKGQGLKDEVFKRLLWVAKKHSETFYNNIWLLPIIGSWKDLWVLMYYDKQFGIHAIDEEEIFDIISQGLKEASQTDLVRKFMPRIKSNSKCTTLWGKVSNSLAKHYAKHCGLTYQEYNKIKSSGLAHEFQQQISAGRYSEISWNKIPGKALSNLTNGNFLRNHNLVENFIRWIMEQPTTKYTGYVFELLKKYLDNKRGGNLMYKNILINKQFDELVSKAEADGKISGNVLCALDTSGSMSWGILGTNVSVYDVCVSLGMFFSTLNKGAFHKNVAMFDNHSRLLQLSGTFTEMVDEILAQSTAWGSTNFQSLIDEIVRVRKTRTDIPLEDFPKTILVVSDMQFNPAGGYQTNYEAMKNKLLEAFPEDFVNDMKFIWWDCIGRREDAPATMEDNGCYFFSGFDGSIISQLLGTEVEEKDNIERKNPTMEEVLNKALTQDILLNVEV
ncbi:MAG: DUF2828 family protein [Bacteroidaceae bacterium]|nr:DUF2828 family protein [Bacteroidaceae bacterium]